MNNRPPYKHEDWAWKQFSLTKAMHWIANGDHEPRSTYADGVKKFLQGSVYDHAESYKMDGQKYYAVNPYGFPVSYADNKTEAVNGYQQIMLESFTELERWGWATELSKDSVYQPTAFEVRFYRLSESERWDLRMDAINKINEAKETLQDARKNSWIESWQEQDELKRRIRYCEARAQVLNARY